MRHGVHSPFSLEVADEGKGGFGRLQRGWRREKKEVPWPTGSNGSCAVSPRSALVATLTLGGVDEDDR